jgi:predicted nucleic acid-binding protein
MTRGLLDTSVVIALARDDELELELPPAGVTISAVTLCGLHHGVLAASDSGRAARLAVLTYAERVFVPLPVDETVAPHYGRLAAAARQEGRVVRGQLADLLIAATAAAHRLCLYTRDERQARLPGIDAALV